MGARGHGIVIAQKMSIVLGQVVENQRSVQRTVRRDRTTSFLFVLADFLIHVVSTAHAVRNRALRVGRESGNNY